MRNKAMIGLMLGGLVAVGCDQVVRSPLAVNADSNASVEKLAGRTSKVAATVLVEHAAGIQFDTDQLGHGALTNQGSPRAFVMVLWSAKNRNNQVFLARSVDTALGTGESAEFFVPLEDSKSHCIQRDFYAGVPIALLQQPHPTTSDYANYFVGGDENIWDKGGCADVPPTVPPMPPLPPVPPPPPPPGPPVCQGAGTLQFPVGSYMATFPVGYPDPWYPTNLGPYAFSIPAGTWQLTSLTGDNHSEKGDEYPGQPDPQTHESAKYEFYNGVDLLGTSVATIDIPLTQDSQFTNLGQMVFTRAVTSIRVIHAGASGEFPNDSFYPVNLTYSCPGGV